MRAHELRTCFSHSHPDASGPSVGPAFHAVHVSRHLVSGVRHPVSCPPVPHFYRSTDEFVAAAQAAIAAAAPRQPVAVLAAEVDPVGTPEASAPPESRLGAAAEIIRHL